MFIGPVLPKFSLPVSTEHFSHLRAEFSYASLSVTQEQERRKKINKEYTRTAQEIMLHVL